MLQAICPTRKLAAPPFSRRARVSSSTTYNCIQSKKEIVLTLRCACSITSFSEAEEPLDPISQRQSNGTTKPSAALNGNRNYKCAMPNYNHVQPTAKSNNAAKAGTKRKAPEPYSNSGHIREQFSSGKGMHRQLSADSFPGRTPAA